MVRITIHVSDDTSMHTYVCMYINVRCRAICRWHSKSEREELIETCCIATGTATGVCTPSACVYVSTYSATREHVSVHTRGLVHESQESPLSGWLRLALVYFYPVLLALVSAPASPFIPLLLEHLRKSTSVFSLFLLRVGEKTQGVVDD